MKSLPAIIICLSLASLGTQASAGPVCQEKMAAVQARWDTAPYPYKKVFQPQWKGQQDPQQTMISSMRQQIRKADVLCKEGNDQEALLRLDRINTWLDQHKN